MSLDDNFVIRFLAKGVDLFFNLPDIPLGFYNTLYTDKNIERGEKVSAIALTTFLEAGAMGCIIGGSILCATGVGAGAGVPLIISGIALSIIGATPLLKFVKWDLQLNPQVAMIAAAIMQKIIIPIISVAMVITGIVFCATGPGVFIGCPLIAVGASLFVASFVFKEA